MNKSKTALSLLLTGGLLVTTGTTFARVSQQPPPDNTAVNKRDGKISEPTADQSKNTPSDRELARLIRRDVVKDKTLSVYGHNVKIIAQGGKVTLKGPVHTEDEKNVIVNYARKRAGDGNVSDELSVKNDGK
jgi:hyperosmotically inducible protein